MRDALEVDFFGGEPLLNFDVVKIQLNTQGISIMIKSGDSLLLQMEVCLQRILKSFFTIMM